MLRSLSYKKISDSLWLSGRNGQVPFNSFVQAGFVQLSQEADVPVRMHSKNST